MTANEAIEYLRRLVALDGAFHPCLEECDHAVCELALRVLAVLERVR